MGKGSRATDLAGNCKPCAGILQQLHLGWISIYCEQSVGWMMFNSRHFHFEFGIHHSLHPSERIFWLISVVLSALGVFYLISEYQRDFNSRAVSIVYESISPLAPVKYPSVAICGLPTEQIDKLVDYVER